MVFFSFLFLTLSFPFLVFSVPAILWRLKRWHQVRLGQVVFVLLSQTEEGYVGPVSMRGKGDGSIGTGSLVFVLFVLLVLFVVV